MGGHEHLNVEVLQQLWESLGGHIWKEGGWAPRQWLQKQNRSWQRVGKLVIHLSENLEDLEHPFFLKVDYVAALTGRGGLVFMNDPSLKEWLSSEAQVHWVSDSLKDALSDFVDKLRSAAQKSGDLSSCSDSVMNCIRRSNGADEIQLGRAGAKGSYHLGRNHPWTAEQAFKLLLEVSRLEGRGFELVVPEWWIARQSRRLKALVTVGDQKTQNLGMKALLDFSVKLTIGDEELSEEELRAVLASSSRLVRVKDKWVAVDQERLKALLIRWEALRQGEFAKGIPLFKAMRLLSGFDLENAPPSADNEIGERTRVVPGAWLETTLAGMRDPAKLQDRPADPDLLAALRPYQETGVGWLRFMSNLGLGACLADDMGLGKTIQVLALLLRLKREGREADPESVPQRHLLVVPASLIGNWTEEIRRHAPSLSVVCVHPSEMSAADQEAIAADPGSRLLGHDVVLTSYGMVPRLAWLSAISWDLMILDEAQAVKNAGSKQSQATKKLAARARIALTGTPVENRLADLWSLFDFLNPGLLGSAKAFNRYLKEAKDQVGPLRVLTRPYILRRLKTDKAVIEDLPDKIETRAFCALSTDQAALYQRLVKDLKDRVEQTEGIQRRGIILAAIQHFKQICNHPAQWCGNGAYDESESGKFQRLRELCEQIAELQEKVLVFTQYRELTTPLEAFLSGIFGRQGLVLHGGTPVGERHSIVEAFQLQNGPPFFVLSLKAGGTGLNLTEAAHVIHFDRWWNPAVENQATDRAHRIGQKKTVMVHKLLCRGTIEERIDELIEAKTGLARELLEQGLEKRLTEMGNEELLNFVALDIHSSVGLES
jgi:non-specific serine/threonine protein kinase